MSKVLEDAKDFFTERIKDAESDVERNRAVIALDVLDAPNDCESRPPPTYRQMAGRSSAQAGAQEDHEEGRA